MLKRQEGWQLGGDKPLYEIGQVAVQKAHLLMQRATPKAKHLCKLKNKKQTIKAYWEQGAGWGITDLAPKKGGKAKRQARSKQAQ
jgi:hypothetical protein